MSLAEGSDEEDLVGLDDDVSTGLIDFEAGSAAEEEEEWGGIGEDVKKRKREPEKKMSGKGRKKLRSLPTFATYEDYAKMIEDGPEDDV